MINYRVQIKTDDDDDISRKCHSFPRVQHFYVGIMDHKLLLLEDVTFHFHQQYSNIFSSFNLDNDLAQKYAT